MLETRLTVMSIRYTFALSMEDTMDNTRDYSSQTIEAVTGDLCSDCATAWTFNKKTDAECSDCAIKAKRINGYQPGKDY